MIVSLKKSNLSVEPSIFPRRAISIPAYTCANVLG